MKIVINKKDVYIEHEIENVAEFNMQELDNFIGIAHEILSNFHQETIQNVPDAKEPQPEVQEPVEYASDGQRKYMNKLGIQFTDQTTKDEAIAMINKYKRNHGIPVNKNFNNY